MLAQDVAEFNAFAINLFENELGGIPLYITDVDTDEPDETNIWCRFAINPDVNRLATVGENNRFDQLGSAVLQIIQPRSLALSDDQKNAWEIADVAMKAFRSFKGSDNRITINNLEPQRITQDDVLQVNLLIFFKSRHT